MTEKPILTHAAICLSRPKFARNVASSLRAASCYGASHLFYSGQRVEDDMRNIGRWPREERMKGYKEVCWRRADRFVELFDRRMTPVAIELRPGSEELFAFEHPPNAIYIFGPEDGSIEPGILCLCHRFVVIPTRHCLNLATAVTTVLYDRAAKRHALGLPREIALPGPNVEPEDDLVFLADEDRP